MIIKTDQRFCTSGNHIYMATDIGMLDLGTKEISDFYSEIGPNGSVVSVQDLFVYNDSLFAISNEGILASI